MMPRSNSAYKIQLGGLALFLSVAMVGCVEHEQETLSDLFSEKPAAELSKLPAPAGLSPSEVSAWNAMSAQRQHDARKFMLSGGSFRDFLAV